MAVIRNLFRTAEAEQPHVEDSSSVNYSRQARAIQYDPKLVPQLEDDHAELLSTYSRVNVLLSEGRFEDIPKALKQFKTRLEGHLLTENVRFYNYVEQQLAKDPVNIEIIRDFRKEMNSIARTVVGFLKTYISSGVNTGNFNAFRKEYRAIGEALQDRIEREERDLYALYWPPED
jgi:regulator of sigma D